MKTARRKKGLTGWHVLGFLFVFFGVGFAVNGAFVYHAVSSFPGEDVKKSYVQGLAYNDTLAARARQADLGWRAEIGLEDDVVLLRLETLSGEAVLGRDVTGRIVRAATDAHDQTLAFEPRGDGLYAAPVAKLDAGRWRIRALVHAHGGEDIVFTADKTLIAG